MPPWPIDKVGTRHFQNDRSLTDDQVATIVKWVDAGAPKGDMKDMPAPVKWPNEETWNFASIFGEPDLIINSPPYKMPARAQGEAPGSSAARDGDDPGPGLFMEWAVGKQGKIMRENSGKLMLPGSSIVWDIHDHAVGEEITDQGLPVVALAKAEPEDSKVQRTSEPQNRRTPEPRRAGAR